ncbi:response regulator transcription factor [Salinibacterium sp. ZJ454]|uniref:response regulator transcription factor n=1 Tax=Salinibacterium sp. ZJ454 TaxID=2708339 RepID=UPI001424396B|nr:response regulator transcription factor [Salinibacterium sp. ZJ454]
MRILVVEHYTRIANLLVRSLAEAGYAVDTADGDDPRLLSFQVGVHDLVILDVAPEDEGTETALCEAIRGIDTDIPILMLTTLHSPSRRARVLDAGADDYLVKPFHEIEFLARVRALLRRAPHADPPILQAQGVRLNPATRSAERGGRQITLTAKEYAVLEYLMRNAGTIVSSTALIDHAWDQNYEGFSNVVQTYIRYIRQKLTAAGERDIIETRRGSGYTIAADSPDAGAGPTRPG